jgi:hypothetical protein
MSSDIYKAAWKKNNEVDKMVREYTSNYNFVSKKEVSFNNKKIDSIFYVTLNLTSKDSSFSEFLYYIFSCIVSFNFKDTSSSSKDFFTSKKNSVNEKREKINLEEHTFNTLLMFLSNKDFAALTEEEKKISIVICLLHDFGKNDNVKSICHTNEELKDLINKEISKNSKDNKLIHSFYSALFFKFLFKKLTKDTFIQSKNSITIYNVLVNHHKESSLKGIDNKYLNILTDSDTKAVKYEIDKLENSIEEENKNDI